MRIEANLSIRILTFITMLAITAFLTISYSVAVVAAETVAPDVYWEKSFGGDGADTAYAVTQSANDNSYVFAGTTQDERYVYAVKVDQAGQTLWTKTFGGTYWRNVARAVYQTTDNGFIMAGYSKAQWYMGNERIHLVKTDSNGNLEWEKRIFVKDGQARANGFGVLQASDGGYIVVGSFVLYDQSDIYVCKTDSQGNVEWEKEFGGAGWDYAYAVSATKDNGFIVTGHMELDGRKLALIKFDETGSVEWQQNYESTTRNFTGKSVKQTTDGGYVATGYNGSNIFLMKTDFTGKKLWEKTYSEGIGYSVVVAKDGGYVITGRGGSTGVIVIRTDKSGNKVWEKTLGSAGATGFSIQQTKDKYFVVSGDSAGNAYLATLEPEKEAVINVSSPNVLKDGHILVYSAIKEGEGLVRTGNVDVKIKIDATGEEIQLKDQGAEGDMSANDGIYSAWYKVTQENEVEIDLYLTGKEVDSTKVKVIEQPKLVVISDLKKLYDEFVDTGMQPADDNNNNIVPDYYDLLNRMNQYASKHNGVVFDLSSEITTVNGFAKDYKDLNYETADVYDMGMGIDELINKISTTANFKNVAIIGDDRVVPFFRRTDPIHMEQNYSAEIGGTLNNTTLLSSDAGQLLTDVPYGSYAKINPDTVAKPTLDAGVGRIFADRPIKLAGIFDGYETPIALDRATRTAVLYTHKKDTVWWQTNVGAGLLPVLNAQMTGKYVVTDVYENVLPYTPGTYYNYNGNLVNWDAAKVTTAVNNANLTMFWSHANHELELTQNNPDLTVADFDAMPESPGHLLINEGCHSGYTVSQTGDNPDYYDDAMAKSLMEKKVTYFAPIGYGLLVNNGDAAYSNLLLTRIAANSLDNTTSTVGQAQTASYTDYWASVNPMFFNNESTYIAFGTILYGLPTQPIEHGGGIPVPAPAPGPGPAPAPAPAGPVAANTLRSFSNVSIQSTSSLDFAVKIPNFKVVTDSEGKVKFEVPNGGTQMVTSFAPSVPLITKSFQLPNGSEINSVELVNAVSSVYSDPVELQKIIPISATHGPLEGSFEVPNPYPGKLFWWSASERNGGVLLNISMVPLQYNPDTKMAILYNEMDFSVSYIGETSATTIDEVYVNSGNGVQTGSANVPVGVAISSPTAQELGLLWTIKDQVGQTLASGTQSISLQAGSNAVNFEFDTTNWTPGSKELSVSLFDTAVRETKNVEITVCGVNIGAKLQKEVYSPADNLIQVTVEARDELGAVIGSLETDNFVVALDGNTVSVADFEETSPGFYSISFDPARIEPGIHSVSVKCIDTRGAANFSELYFQYKTDVTPPVISLTVPAEKAEMIAIDSDITIRFNEPITRGGSLGKITVKAGDRISPYTARIEGADAVLSPDNLLESNTLYTVNVPAGAVEDISQNELAEAYSFSFKTLPNTNAALTELKVGGTKVDGFASNRFTYDVVLPYGTAEVPEITWTMSYSKAKVELIPAPGVWGTAQIKVTAEDGITTQTYILKFSIAKNTDANLSDLKVGGQTVLGFSQGKTACFFILPYGTTELPPITAMPTDSINARYEITPAEGVDGTASIEVTAEDGTTKKTYTIDFSVARNNDAYLKDLQIDGQTVEGFSTYRYSYVVELPEGTVEAPQVAVLANDSGAWVETIQSPKVPGTAVVVITAADGVTTRLYSVTFSIPGHTDSSLKDIKVDGQTVPGFASDKFNYEYILPIGTIEVPEVSAEVYDVGATMEIIQAGGPEGTAMITVTSQNGKNSRTYSIIFRLLENDGAMLSNLKVDGNTVDSFAADRLNYEMTLPFGTTQVPEVTAESQDPEADVFITKAKGLPGTTQVSVVSEDGRISREYTVSFLVAPSASADLADLTLDGETILGFSPGQLNYQVLLPAGTSVVPVLAAVYADPQAKMSMTLAQSVTGMAQILVTSSDGRVTKTYTVTFNVEENPSAVLSDLNVNGITLPGFSPDILNYEVLLPAGTMEVPGVSAVPVDPGAVVKITLPDDLTGLATILVTSSDGRLTQTYSISFRLIQIGDASLSDLRVDDITLTGFASGKLNYEEELAYGTTEIPRVSAVSTDPVAKVSIVQADNVNGIATVVVTSADGRLTRTYTVNFSVEYIAPVISSTLEGTVLPRVEKAFTVATTANSETGELVRVKVTLADPSQQDKVALLYQEVLDGQYYPLTFDANGIAWYGPSAGFPLGDVTSDFKATFNTPGDYGYRLEIVKAGSDEVLASTLGNVRALNNDATLSNIKVNGYNLNGFTSDQLICNVVLPYGTTAVPEVTATASDSKAQVNITQAASVNGTAKVVVTAEDGTTQQIYTINFSVAPYTDVTLSDLKVDGTTITGFISSQDSYNVVLPYGTITVPVVTATPTDANAAIEITQAENVTGTAIVVVKANGMPTKIYTINFSVAPNSDATLSDLQVGGATVIGFTGDQFSYNVVLPYGTTAVPVVSATSTDENATCVVTQSTSINGTATVVVTAEDGITQQTYTINFRVAPNTDASLSNLEVGGNPVVGFASDKYSYNIVLPYGTTSVPVVTATTTDEKAAIEITQAGGITGTATIKVTAKDGITTKTYTVTFTLAEKPHQPGSGGGGRPSDTTGPIVVSTVPAEKHPISVNINTPIHINFDEQIQVGSAISNVIIKAENESVQFSYKIEGVVLKLIPAKEIFPGMIYTIQIPAGAVKDMAGNGLVQPYSFSFTTKAVGNPFKDVSKDHWAVNEIVYLHDLGIVSGFPDMTFRPQKQITRAEMAVMIAKALKLDTSLTPDMPMFLDTPKKHWGYNEIEAAMKAGVMIGYGNGLFKPDALITREELVKVIIKALNYGGAGEHNVSTEVLNQFKDHKSISMWAREPVAEAVGREIVKGISPGVFGAGVYGSRDQAAVLIYRLIGEKYNP